MVKRWGPMAMLGAAYGGGVLAWFHLWGLFFPRPFEAGIVYACAAGGLLVWWRGRRGGER